MALKVASDTFVGRVRELEHVESRLAVVAGGPAPIFLVAGEAGVGKTRFLDEVARRARARGVRVLEGGCVQLGVEGLPFGPIVEALRGLPDTFSQAELDDLLGTGRTALARLMPPLPEPTIGAPLWRNNRARATSETVKDFPSAPLTKILPSREIKSCGLASSISAACSKSCCFTFVAAFFTALPLT